MGKKKTGKNIHRKISLCLLVLFIFPFFSSCLTVTPYNAGFDKLPDSFDEFKIAVIADLHSYHFGKNQKRMIDRIMEQNPDMVVLVGDIIDKHDRNIAKVRELLEGIYRIYPVYAVAGNHELINKSQFPELLDAYREYGVVFLDGQTVLLEKEDNRIAVSTAKLVPGKIYGMAHDSKPLYKDEFNIFLYHFGNEFDSISDEYDLVISGHVHGGVIRIFKKGLLGYNRGPIFFPKYTKGIYRKESGSVMVLSAGLGNTVFPRINNPREIVMITLKIIE